MAVAVGSRGGMRRWGTGDLQGWETHLYTTVMGDMSLHNTGSEP